MIKNRRWNINACFESTLLKLNCWNKYIFQQFPYLFRWICATPLVEMTKDMRSNKLLQLIDLIYEGGFSAGAPLIPASCGREEAESGGWDWWWEGEIEWEAHRETKRIHHNKSSPTIKEVEIPSAFYPTYGRVVFNKQKFCNSQQSSGRGGRRGPRTKGWTTS